jgi:hypothetical protein
MLDPLAKRLVIPQRPPNTESKVTDVGVHKSWCDATITTMAVNQRQFAPKLVAKSCQELR